MPFHSFLLRSRMLALGAVMALGQASGRAEQLRFSKTLTPIEGATVGLQHLSSDQVAVLDALIRRDERAFPTTQARAASTTKFVERLTPEERHNAGLDHLTTAELSQIDTLIARYESAWTPALLPSADTTALEPQISTSSLELHGMISFTYGTGSGGYHSMGGAMAVSIDDPAHGASLLVGYSQSRTSGPGVGRRCYWSPLATAPWLDPFGPLGP